LQDAELSFLSRTKGFELYTVKSMGRKTKICVHTIKLKIKNYLSLTLPPLSHWDVTVIYLTRDCNSMTRKRKIIAKKTPTTNKRENKYTSYNII
jgi:hypothetical protein